MGTFVKFILIVAIFGSGWGFIYLLLHFLVH
jgi:hypothetical protein